VSFWIKNPNIVFFSEFDRSIKIMVKVKQSIYSPRQTLKVTEGSDSKVSK